MQLILVSVLITFLYGGAFLVAIAGFFVLLWALCGDLVSHKMKVIKAKNRE